MIEALPPPIPKFDVDSESLRRAYEIRLPWDRNDIHFFFSTDQLHDAMPLAVRPVAFCGQTIPIVAPEHLIVRKALLDRPKDRLDIEAILIAAEKLDRDEIEGWVGRLASDEDPRVTKLQQLLRRCD